MLIRCESCQKLYPQHHGECRNCSGGGAPAAAPQKKLSLKERLEASGPAMRSRPTPPQSSPVSSMFKKEAPPEPESEPALPELELERAKIPEQKTEVEEEREQSWTPENGGLCPSCEFYNPASNVFCHHCEYMLIKSEITVEIVTSYPLTEIHGLVHTFIDKLKNYKVHTTEDMLRVGCFRKNRLMLAKATGMSERSLMRLVHLSDMCRIPSINPEQVGMLEMIAINSMADLLKLKPSIVMTKPQQSRMQINRAGIMYFPTKSRVKQWFEEARELQPLKIQP